MGLRHYYVDTSTLPLEERKAAMHFIEMSSYVHSYVPGTTAAYYCFWDEAIDISKFPKLKDCVIKELSP